MFWNIFHKHDWDVVGVEYWETFNTLSGIRHSQFTIVKRICKRCKKPDTIEVKGSWKLEDFQ